MRLLTSVAVVWVSLFPALSAADDPAELSDRAQQLAQQNRLAEAEKLWKEALALDNDFFPALFNLGYLNYSLGRLEAAATYLDQAGRANSADFNTFYLLGAARQKQERREDAVRAWRKALAIRPEHPKLMQILIVELGRGRYYNEAADMAIRALESQPRDLNAHLLAITACRQAGDRVRGLEIAELAAKRFPESARTNFEYAWHLQKFGRFEEGRPYLERAMQLDPNYEEPFFFHGDWLVEQGRYAQAVEPLERAIALRQDYTPARARLARAYMGLENYEAAIRELEETIRREPRHPLPHLLLSQIYFRLGDRKKAAEAKRVSLRLRRQNPTVLEAVQGRAFPD